ncbi:hypothetical protein GON01_06650 [Sphingomonas sp. MAH-20]|jgi:hypothetical protein|uniref:Uncharacterized protein n=1 Tax=Sphingomonas horti TaxID=2682842 RepID=A0A6I4J0L6_9SPHN|nr:MULTISPECIES: hypothetical protein [Sphingomonas]MBA2920677.1 hypothetical protein [Sphingomonas sp. CGMCC 1.13658]MVO77613.1 hypothetical protein [Sphingomonas horti]
MLWISLVLVVFVALALTCAVLLSRAAPVATADVEPMKKALERRLRDGVEFRL